MTNTGNHLLEGILSSSSTNACLWWKSVNLGEVIVPSDFNWHLFASGVVVNAYRYAKSNDEKSCLEWAELAISVEEVLGGASEGDTVHACEMTAMTLRANMICQYGHIAGHPILDSGIIIKWFYDRFPFSLTEAMKGEKQQQHLSCEERIKRLKANPAEQFKITYIKNRLTVIDILEKCGNHSVIEELREWLIDRKYF